MYEKKEKRKKEYLSYQHKRGDKRVTSKSYFMKNKDVF